MAVFSIEDVSQTTIQEAVVNPQRNRLNICSRWGVSFDETVASRTDLGKWTFIWFGETNAAPNLQRVVDLLTSGHLSELWGFRGVLIAINELDRCIYVFNDAYGSFPVYVNNSSGAGEPTVTDSLRFFAGRNIDWTSFYQFLSLGYIFGSYTLFEGISRLEANHVLKLSDGDGDEDPVISWLPLKNFWNGSGSTSTDDLIDIFRTEAEGFGATQIMMSGGWDSRLLLSVLAHIKPLLYTHGDLQSREVAIVRDIASVCGLTLVEHGFSQGNFGPELFSSYLRENESAMFAHWHPAGMNAAENGLMMTAGTFGEVLGGHYGVLNTLPGSKKHASLLMHMVGAGAFLDDALQLHDTHTLMKYLRMSSYGAFWLLNGQLADELRSKELVEQSNQRLAELFKSYEGQGIEDAQLMFERFYTEHRGGQYINRQLFNAAQGNCFRNIFTNRDLLAAVSSIPFSQRVHNKVNKEIIRKLNPKLLDFPMAATLANARRPILMQEASRAARKLFEGKSPINSLYRRFSRYGDCNFGWNNFSEIVTYEWMEMISPFLSEKIWSHKNLTEAVKSSEYSNAYPLFDMVSKAITIDYLLDQQVLR